MRYRRPYIQLHRLGKERILVEQQKTSVPVEIPLSAVVGNAIYDYLAEERPDTGSLRLFLSETHPFSPLAAGSIGNIVAKACRLAGIRQEPGDRKGTHIFRHNLASSMLENGVPQPVITQTLGHTAPDSLEPYLRADFVHLKECALSIEAFPLAEEVFFFMKEFRSFLAPQIRHFIRYRQASQRWNDSSYEENLMLFDGYCLENYPGDTMLTQEMVDGWCRQRHTEANNSCRSRIYVVDSFVRFLNGRGLSPVQPPQIPRKEMRTYIPHAFTQEELSRFFHECDHIPVINNRKETVIRKNDHPRLFPAPLQQRDPHE